MVIIDVQKGFINKNAKDVVLKIKKYISRNKKRYDLIIFTQYKNRKNSNFVKSLDWHGFMSKNETDLADEILEFVNEKNLFTKYTYGSFIDNKVYNLLQKHKIDKVELVGFDAENCVLTFARDAFDRGMSVVVLKDLCASHSNKKLHKVALEIIEDNIGEIK